MARPKRRKRRNGLFDDDYKVACPRCGVRANERCLQSQAEIDLWGEQPHWERSDAARASRLQRQKEEAEQLAIEALERRGRLEAARDALEKPKKGKKKNPAAHEFLSVGASVLGAASGLLKLLNPLTKAEQAYYNKRIHHYIRLGYSGAAAGTLVKQEIMKRRSKRKTSKNPKIRYAYSSYGKTKKKRRRCVSCGKNIKQRKLGRPKLYCKRCRAAGNRI